MKYVILLLFAIFLVKCSSPESRFLNKFNIKESDKYVNEIDTIDLSILLATNEVNQPVYNVRHKYFYGYKKKLEGELYLVSYMDCYVPLNAGTNRIWNWYDIFECIYDSKKNCITSKLRIWSSEPVLSFYSVNQGIYTIKSMYNIDIYDGQSESSHNVTKKIINRYRIRGNKYICIE